MTKYRVEIRRTEQRTGIYEFEADTLEQLDKMLDADEPSKYGKWIRYKKPSSVLENIVEFWEEQ